MVVYGDVNAILPIAVIALAPGLMSGEDQPLPGAGCIPGRLRWQRPYTGKTSEFLPSAAVPVRQPSLR